MSSPADSLLNIIDDIQPKNLAFQTYSHYVERIFKVVSVSIQHEPSVFLVFIQSIKACNGPSYKRDLLLDVMNQFIFKHEPFLYDLVCSELSASKNNLAWKELANSITSLPELVANCEKLDKYDSFKPADFLIFLANKLYCLFDKISIGSLSIQQKMFLVQTLARISIFDQQRIVLWKEFILPTIKSKNQPLKQAVNEILTIPLSNEKPFMQFGMFIEPLYIPIFFNLKPSNESGRIIKSILSDKILEHEMFEYLLCDKQILQTNYNCNTSRQHMILFNIFSYLAELAQNGSINLNENVSSLLIKTLINIAKSWSNSTKILLRSHEHNRYISYAFIICFRYALYYDKDNLINRCQDIQMILTRGVPTYLNRASCNQRSLAMYLGQILLPRLGELLNMPNKNSDESLEFDLKSDQDYIKFKNLFELDVQKLFPDLDSEQETSTSIGEKFERHSGKVEECLANPSEDISGIDAVANVNINKYEEEDDDFQAYSYSDDSDADSDGIHYEIGEDGKSVPMYLNDCLEGLIENKNRNYVRLCLVKADQLIELLTKETEKADGIMSLSSGQQIQTGVVSSQVHQSAKTHQTIKDNAVELAQILLHLDNQFNIDDFDTLKTKTLKSLCISAPDLVAKFLLDEFNREHRNLRHCLDILQVLVGSAQELSNSSNPYAEKKLELDTKSKNNNCNKFIRYAPLYLYGIMNSLKNDVKNTMNNANLTSKIISAVKSLDTSDLQQETKRETMMRKVITGLTISKNQIENCSIRVGENLNLFPTGSQSSRSRKVQLVDPDSHDDQDTVVSTKTSVTKQKTLSKIETTKDIQYNEHSDDSYLLSRSLLSISMILYCVYQQPIVCKLAKDLLELLAAYRGHPDLTVRKAIVGCLKALCDNSPELFFKDYLHDQIRSLFGSWLSVESELAAFMMPASS